MRKYLWTLRERIPDCIRFAQGNKSVFCLVLALAHPATAQEANEQLGLTLPEGDYMTVAGMVLDHLGHIPAEGETFNVGGVAVRVARMQGRRIARMHFRRLTAMELEAIRPAENLAP